MDYHSVLHAVTNMKLCRATALPSHAGLLALAVMAGLSCGRADDAQLAVSSPPPAGSGGGAGTGPGVAGSASSGSDSGASSDATGGESTPATNESPSAPAMPAPSANRWARNGATGLCSPYDDTGERASNVRVFSTQAECESSCGCTALECVCNATACPATLEEAVQNFCAAASNTGDYPPISVERREGCGRIYITSSNGFVSQGWLFAPHAASDAGSDGGGDGGTATSASLVGSMSFVDVDTEPCATYSWGAGESFDCADAVACQLCGGPLGSTLPACD